jgi:hypothetical protein
MNPKNYDLQGLMHSSKDGDLKVLRLQHKNFGKQMAAKVYSIEDPDDLGQVHMSLVLQQATTNMRTSAHPTCQFNYSYFKRDIKGKNKQFNVSKVAILQELFQRRFSEDLRSRAKGKEKY